MISGGGGGAGRRTGSDWHACSWTTVTQLGSLSSGGLDRAHPPAPNLGLAFRHPRWQHRRPSGLAQAQRPPDAPPSRPLRLRLRADGERPHVVRRGCRRRWAPARGRPWVARGQAGPQPIRSGSRNLRHDGVELMKCFRLQTHGSASRTGAGLGLQNRWAVLHGRGRWVRFPCASAKFARCRRGSGGGGPGLGARGGHGERIPGAAPRVAPRRTAEPGGQRPGEHSPLRRRSAGDAPQSL